MTKLIRLGQHKLPTGRPLLYQARMTPIAVTLPTTHKRTLKAIGRGSVSKGIRTLVDAYMRGRNTYA